MNADERRVAELEHAWLASILVNDADILEPLLANELEYSASSHGRATRQEWLDSIADYRFDELELLDFRTATRSSSMLVSNRMRHWPARFALARI